MRGAGGAAVAGLHVGVPVGTAVVCGAGLGLGLVLIVAGLYPQRPALAELLDRLNRPPSLAPGRGDRVRSVLATPSRRAGLPGAGVRRDLIAARIDPVHYLAGQAAAAILCGLTAPALGFTLLGWSGQAPIWSGLAAAGAGWWWARASLREDAERERTQIRHALSVMLTLMSVSLARGAGIEQALDEAASVCTGPGTDRLIASIRTARLLRLPPWEPLGELGAGAGISELSDLAATMTLAGAEGARIRTALSARAAAMRTTASAQAHTDAEHATSRMTLPLLLLASSYLMFLLYPAIAALQLTSP